MTFTQAEADKIYNELRDLAVALDGDPIAFGPKRLNSKVSEVRRMLERCERLYLDVSQRLHAIRRAKRMAETDLELAKMNLFTNDPETRAGRSVGDREAVAMGKLSKEVHLLHDLEIADMDLAAVLTVIKAKRTDLKDTEGRLRDQIRLCSEEIGLGSRWGSQLPGTPDVPVLPQGDTSANTQVLDSMLGDVDGEIHVNPNYRGWEDSVAQEPNGDSLSIGDVLLEQNAPPVELPPTAASSDVEAFLGDVPVDKPTKADKALTDGLDDILAAFEET